MFERDLLNTELERINPVDYENPAAIKKAKTTAASSHPKKVNLTINWSGVNNGLLDASVEVRLGKKVLNSGSGDGSLMVEVDWAKEYLVVIIPKFASREPDDPDRMYNNTTVKIKNKSSVAGPDTAEMTTNIKLEVNRDNWIHVDASWTQKKINRDLALAVTQTKFLGKSITVNNLTLPKVKTTQAAMEANKADYPRIIASIAKIGSRVLRTKTGSGGAYSNHSLGCALDVNEYMPTMQNHHFLKEKDQQLLVLVQQVVREQVPGQESFNIAKATWTDQLDASKYFSNEFPAWLYKNARIYAPDSSAPPAEAPSVIEYTDTRLNLMIRNAALRHQEELKKRFATILAYKKVLFAWEKGTVVNGVRLFGMIPLDRQFLLTMKANGWGWGGNYPGLTKDYMHFEDWAAVKKIEQ